MEHLAENLWVIDYPFRMLGFEVGRRVTVLRLTSRRLVIHSTASFSPEEVREICALGDPGWLLEATRAHDTFALAGRQAFPEATYLVPPGFPKANALRTQPLLPAPAEWGNEVMVREICGMPWVREHAVFHPATRTLIVADLLFDLRGSRSWLTHFVGRHLMRLPDLAGMSLLYRLMIRDREAFRRSMSEILEWDFERIILGHGQIIERDGRGRLRSALRDAGLA